MRNVAAVLTIAVLSLTPYALADSNAPLVPGSTAPLVSKDGIIQHSALEVVIDQYKKADRFITLGLPGDTKITGKVRFDEGYIALEESDGSILYVPKENILWVSGPRLKK